MRSCRPLAFLVVLPMCGCGTYVPDLQEFYQSPKDGRVLVDDFVDYVACDVKRSVLQILLDDQDRAIERKRAGLPQGETLTWLKGWAAQLTFTLTVDEKSQINPGVALNAVYPNAVTNFAGHPSVSTPQSFSLGLAGAYSSEATRKETLSLYMNFKDFTDSKTLSLARRTEQDGKLAECERNRNGFSRPDIKFMDWLADATLAANVQGGVLNYPKALQAEVKSSKKDVISHEVTFVVIYGANVNPTWKLVNFTGNNGSAPLFGVQRTNTQDVIITLGPAVAGTLGVAALNTTLASQIGVSVANAIRNAQ
jgi:hypothetical protein